MKNFPRQRLSFKEKTKNDYKWAKDVIDRLLSNHVVDPSMGNVRSEYARKLANYQLFNNIINQADFDAVCNPLGLEVGQFKDTIKPYNKTYNKIQVLLGEELSRPFHYKAVLVNSEGVRSKLAHRDFLLKQYVNSRIEQTYSSLSQTYSKELVDSSIDTVIPPEEIDKYFKTSYLDAREILSNKLLNYVSRLLDIKDKKSDAFKHALIAGEEFVYVGEEHDEPYLEILNPLGVFYHKSPEVKFLQDALYAGYRSYLTSGEVLDKFSSYLTEEECKRIDSSFEGKFGIRSDIVGPTMKYFHDEYDYAEYQMHPSQDGSYSDNKAENWLVQHVEWRSQQEVGFVTFTNEFGDEEVVMTSEDFTPPVGYSTYTYTKEYGKKCTVYEWKDSTGNTYSLEWKWLPQIWSGVKIGTDMYAMVGPKKQQYRSSGNPYKIKLGYHGVVYSSMNAQAVSVMDRMKPFQYLYFMVMHKLEKLIAQDQGKVYPFNTTMIDPKVGLEKTLYYLKELNIDFYNPLMTAESPGHQQNAKIHQAVDWSNMQNILSYIQLLSAIDQQISDVAGVSQGREGQIAPTEAVTNAQANIQMSAIITEVYFQAHQKLWSSVMESLLQVAATVYRKKGTVKQFVLDDMSVATLEISPEAFDNVEFGIFMSDPSQDKKLFDSLEMMGEALARANKATFSDLIKMFKATSAEALEREIIASEDKAQKQQQEMMQQEMQAQQQLQQQQQEFELYKQERELETKIKVAEIQSFSFNNDQDVNDNQVPDQLEVEKFKVDTAVKLRKLDQDDRKLDIQEKALKSRAINKSK